MCLLALEMTLNQLSHLLASCDYISRHNVMSRSINLRAVWVVNNHPGFKLWEEDVFSTTFSAVANDFTIHSLFNQVLTCPIVALSFVASIHKVRVGEGRIDVMK